MNNPETSARVIILHGDDSVGIKARLDALVAGLGDPATAEMNVSRLDGRTAGLDEIAAAAGVMPFLAPYRLAVISEPPRQNYDDAPRSRFLEGYTKDENAREKLLAFFAGMPDTGRVALAVDDQPEKKGGWQVLKDSHWLVHWAHKNPGLAAILHFPQPPVKEMPKWIINKAAAMKGIFTPAAAAELVTHVDNHTLLAEMEIGKLLDYVNYARPVEQEDVQRLVTYVGAVDIFEMIDALAVGDSARAARLLNLLLDREQPEVLFGMITRQFRLLLAAREIREEGGRADRILSEMSGEPFRVNHPFVAEKLYNQAGRYSLLRLEAIYRSLLEVSQAMKFGDPRTELLLFVTSVAGQAGR